MSNKEKINIRNIKIKKVKVAFLIFCRYNSYDIIPLNLKQRSETMWKKVSLVTLLAMGLGNVATATPLTEAIKSVDINGMLRVRFYNDRTNKIEQTKTIKYGYNRWRTNAKLVFTVHADENLAFVWRTSVQSDNYSKASKDDVTHRSTLDAELKSNLLFFKYGANGFGLIGGKIPVATPITSADPITTAHGAGVIGTYKPMDGLTLAAGWVDKLLNWSVDDETYARGGLDNDIYTVAAIYNVDTLGLQAWFFRVTNLLTYDIVLRANYKLPIGDGEFVKFAADYAQAKADEDFDPAKKIHRYVHIGAEGKIAGFDVGAGYAATNKYDADKSTPVELSHDSPIAYILPVEQRYAIANERGIKAWYLKAGYDLSPAIKLNAGYAKVDQKEEYGNADSSEWKIGATYAYNKKVTFDAYFDDLIYASQYNRDGNPNNQEVRIEAKYKF